MASGDASARGLPRARLAAGRERKRAVRTRQVEAILADRAKGFKVERIASERGIALAEVERVLRDRRAAGDKRALTDHQAVRAAADAKAAAIAARNPPAPVPPPPAASPLSAPLVVRAPSRRPVRAVTFTPAEAGEREAYVSRLRQMAEGLVPASRQEVCAGLHHLADLFEHCPTAYPDYAIAPGTATLASTDRQFPRAVRNERSLHTSYGALCAAG